MQAVISLFGKVEYVEQVLKKLDILCWKIYKLDCIDDYY